VRLPYADNLVSLLVAEDLKDVPMDEVLRVLVPDGVAYVKQDGRWTRTVKPRPAEMDEWTHYLHDPSNNAVAHDAMVGPPRRLQWVGSPRWSRHHDHMASLSALVSSNGRIFYIMDEGPRDAILLPAKWVLIARDAFNGTILWKRPIAEWNTHLWPLKSGPNQLPRRLVALGDRVYVTLGIDAPLSVLDAATGKTVRTYTGTEHTDEIIASDGVLFLLVAELPNKWKEYRPNSTYVWDNTGRDIQTGDVKSEFPPDVKPPWFHHRCYRSRATDKYFIASRTGIEFIDLKAKHWDINHWVRGGCLYGFMPCNGLLYAPPHSCGCFLESKLFGFNALAAESAGRREPRKVPDDARLERGPLYDVSWTDTATAAADEWPTYRHDALRSGSARTFPWTAGVSRRTVSRTSP